MYLALASGGMAGEGLLNLAGLAHATVGHRDLLS